MNCDDDVNLKSQILLHDGTKMPLFGLGVSMARTGVSGEAEKAVTSALNHGYIMIDTAARYGNEEDVGRAVKLSGKNRAELFIVTKLWSECHGSSRAVEAFHQSLLRLDMDYVDMYLIHSPYNGKIVETYKALMQLQRKGLIRSLGVSNFGIEHLEGMKETGLPKPTVNQIELNPWQRKTDLVEYCRWNNIAVMGYSPLAKAYKMDDPLVLHLSKKYGKTYAQICIRWSVQRGFITIPKSAKEERIIENASVFDWCISDKDMESLDNLEEWVCGWDPQCPWLG